MSKNNSRKIRENKRQKPKPQKVRGICESCGDPTREARHRLCEWCKAIDGEYYGFSSDPGKKKGKRQTRTFVKKKEVSGGHDCDPNCVDRSRIRPAQNNDVRDESRFENV